MSSAQPKPRRLWWAGLLAAACVVFWIFPPFRVVPLQHARLEAQAAELDAGSIAETFWHERLPGLADGAVDVEDLLAAFSEDPLMAAEQYGHRLGVSSRASYYVKGGGKVAAVETNKVQIALPQGGSIIISTGPVFGNAISDGSSLLSVSDFANSQDFNAVSSEINRRVEELVLPGLREQVSVGSEVDFVGGVTLADTDSSAEPLKLTPFSVDLQ